MVEIIIVLYYVFNFFIDKIVFDVFYQSYVYKMFIGRMVVFFDLVKYDDVIGYINLDESEYDFFMIGYILIFVLLVMGFVKGCDFIGGKENIIVVIGDGLLSGGEVLEGFNNVVMFGFNMIIIVNDND